MKPSPEEQREIQELEKLVRKYPDKVCDFLSLKSVILYYKNIGITIRASNMAGDIDPTTALINIDWKDLNQRNALNLLSVLYELTAKTSQSEFPNIQNAMAKLRGLQLIKTLSIEDRTSIILTLEGLHTVKAFRDSHKATYNKRMKALTEEPISQEISP